MAIVEEASGIDSAGGTSSTGRTISINVPAGSNELNVWIGFRSGTGNSVNSVTYDGTSMTERDSIASATTKETAFTLKDPSTGSNNLVVSLSASTIHSIKWEALSGVDAFVSSATSSNNGNTSSGTATCTGTFDYCSAGSTKKNNGTHVAGTNQTNIATDEVDDAAWYDYNNQVSNNTTDGAMEHSSDTSGDWALVAMSFSESAGTTGSHTGEVTITPTVSLIKRPSLIAKLSAIIAPAFSHNGPIADLKVQHNAGIIGADEDSGTFTWATLGWDAPGSLSSAFLIPTAVNQATGPSAGTTANRNDDDAGFTMELTSTGVTVYRESTGVNEDVRIAFAMVEYVGDAGGDNEFIVRDRGRTTTTSTSTTPTLSGTYTDWQDVVANVIGVQSNQTGRTWDRGLHTATMSSGPTLTLDRGDGTGTCIVSWEAIEFTGANWTVEQVTHAISTAGSNETETLSTATGAWATKLIFHSHRSTSNGLDETGINVWPGSTTSSVRFRSRSGAGGAQNITAYVLEHSDLSVTHEDSITGSGTDHPTGSASPQTIDVTISEDSAQAFVVASADCAGSGTAYPRNFWLAYLASDTILRWFRARHGQASDWAYQLVDTSGITAGGGGVLETFTAAVNMGISVARSLRPSKVRSLSITPTLGRITQVDTNYSVSITPSISRLIGVLKTFAVSITPSVSFTGIKTKTMAFAVSITPSIVRNLRPGKALGTPIGISPSRRITAAPTAKTVDITPIVSLTRLVGVTRSVAGLVAPSLTTSKVRTFLAQVSITPAVSFVGKLVRVFSASVNMGISAVAAIRPGKVLDIPITPAVDLIRQANTPRTVGITPSVDSLRLPGRVFDVLITPSVSFTGIRTIVFTGAVNIGMAINRVLRPAKTRSVGIAPSVDLIRQANKGRSVSIGPVVDMLKGPGKSLVVSITPSINTVFDALDYFAHLVKVTITPTVSSAFRPGKIFSVMITPAISLARLIGSNKSVTITPSVDLIRQANKTRSVSITPTIVTVFEGLTSTITEFTARVVITPSVNLIKGPGRRFLVAITPSAALRRLVGRVFSTPLGIVVNVLRRIFGKGGTYELRDYIAGRAEVSEDGGPRAELREFSAGRAEVSEPSGGFARVRDYVAGEGDES